MIANAICIVNEYSGLLQTVLLVIAAIYAHAQLRHSNTVAISERVMSHNSLIFDDKLRRDFVATLEKLNVPADKKDEYWVARTVHMSHIDLLSQVWELSGRPKKGKKLAAHFAGWQNFAKDIVAKPLFNGSERASKEGDKNPFDLAASDLWKGIRTYEITGSEFSDWLTGLAERKPGEHQAEVSPACAASHSPQLTTPTKNSHG